MQKDISAQLHYLSGPIVVCDSVDLELSPDILDGDPKDLRNWLEAHIPSIDKSSIFTDPCLFSIFHTLLRICRDINDNRSNVDNKEVLYQLLKMLKVAVCQKETLQYFLKYPDLCFGTLNNITQLVLIKEEPNCNTKYLFQLYCNLLSSPLGDNEHKKLTERIRDICKSKIDLEPIYAMFSQGISPQFDIISAVIYLMHLNAPLEDPGLISVIFKCYSSAEVTQNDYIAFIVEKLLTAEYIWLNFDTWETHTQSEILQALHDFLIEFEAKIHLPPVCLLKISLVFLKYCPIVFTVDQIDIINNMSCVLEIISHLTGEEKYLPLVKQTDILISAGALLLNVHRLGQIPNSPFAPIQKLAEINEPSEAIRRDPVFGFKVDLIRLIGNLCWKNKTIQDLARTADLIPVLLDCCNIDAKNPLIIQWAIFAVRNLCDKNEENQKIIACLTKRGNVSSEALKEMGLTLHSSEEMSIGIVELKK